MSKTLSICFLSLSILWATQGFAQKPAFIENKGQWAYNFDYSLPLGKSEIFLEGGCVTFKLVRNTPFTQHGKEPDFHGKDPDSLLESHAYRMIFIGANTGLKPLAQKKRREYLNFFIGNDPKRWKGQVGLYEKVEYPNLYPRTDVVYHFSQDGNLKYDLVLKPGADPEKIRIKYEGQEGLKLVYGNLMIYTTIENVLESAPYAYQWRDGKQLEIPCSYRLEGNILSFELGEYDPSVELIIDPKLVFSTYTGSTYDNFGFTATYASDGSAYGGGVVFGSAGNYPTKLAYQSTSANVGDEMDIAITKFTSDGKDIIYSTYLGGADNEMPYSLLEAQNGDLIILGNTGSDNFPVSASAFQPALSKGPQIGAYRTYDEGMDIFMARFSAGGDQLIGSTFLGDTMVDGLNSGFNLNYGDRFRGDIGEDSNGNIYAVSNTFSADFPTKGNLVDRTYGGGQDGVVFSFNSDFSTLRWSSFVGGADDDALFSLKLVGDTMLYITGATSSTGMVPAGFNAYQSSKMGLGDGFIAALRPNDGLMQYATYNGTAEMDANYFLEFNKDGGIYVFGQTRGDYPVGGVNNIYSQDNGPQFIQLFTRDLQSSLRSTVFGTSSPDGRANISPIALMVDDCKNVYVSGWGGGNNLNRRSPYFQGTTNGMYITNSAYQKSTDGSDFYFLVLDATWEKVNYASYFGQNGGTGDHVDGGTSRFRKDGTIFQAVCASCGSPAGFPVSDSAYSRVNRSNAGGRCNLAVFKFSIESNRVIADLEFSEDSACVPYIANLIDNSYNADLVLMERPNHSLDTLQTSFIKLDKTGYEEIRFIAIDTTCDLFDTTSYFFYGFEDSLEVDFWYTKDSCINDWEVRFFESTKLGSNLTWSFGDGSFSQDDDPVHEYSLPGDYKVTLYATNAQCGTRDSITKTISLRELSKENDFGTSYDPCEDNLQASFSGKGLGFQKMRWFVNDSLVQTGPSNDLKYTFGDGGLYEVRLESEDTICNRLDTATKVLQVLSLELEDMPYIVPNVFTPNGDGNNDEFKVIRKFPSDDGGFMLKIFNRWGNELFRTSDETLGWRGNFKNEEVPQGVYYYLLNYVDACGFDREEKGFLHLYR